LRFHTIRTTIVVQRVCIVVACLLWMAVFSGPQPGVSVLGQKWSNVATAMPSKDILVAVIIGLSTVERMCAVGNQFVMERDWVPTLADETSRPPLHTLNAIMRRIDLISKYVTFVLARDSQSDRGLTEEPSGSSLPCSYPSSKFGLTRLRSRRLRPG